MASASAINPRLIRLRDAPSYLGLDKMIFNRDIRPELTEVHHGRAVLFDRLELDAWAEHTKACQGRPPERTSIWQDEDGQDSARKGGSGTSRKSSPVTADSVKALAKRITRERSDTSINGSKNCAKSPSTAKDRR